MVRSQPRASLHRRRIARPSLATQVPSRLRQSESGADHSSENGSCFRSKLKFHSVIDDPPELALTRTVLWRSIGGPLVRLGSHRSRQTNKSSYAVTERGTPAPSTSPTRRPWGTSSGAPEPDRPVAKSRASDSLVRTWRPSHNREASHRATGGGGGQGSDPHVGAPTLAAPAPPSDIRRGSSRAAVQWADEAPGGHLPVASRSARLRPGSGGRVVSLWCRRLR